MNIINYIWGMIQGIILVPALFIWALPGTGFLAHHVNDYIPNDLVYVIVMGIFLLFYFMTFTDHPMDQWTYEGDYDENGIPVRVYK